MAAAGKYALENNVLKLNIDRDKALKIEKQLQNIDWVEYIYLWKQIVDFCTKEKEKRDLLIQNLKKKKSQLFLLVKE